MSTIHEPAARRALRLALTPLAGVEVRDSSGTGDGSWTIEGYAAVYEQETTLYEIPGWVRLREEIARGAFERVLERVGLGVEVVHLNHGHDMKTVLAATDVSGVGGLELEDDFHGLRFFARVDPDDPDARALAVKMGRKVIRQASFAFTIAAEELVESDVLEDGTLDQKWRILEIGHLYDVCVAAQGAYPQTESHFRSLAAASLRTSERELEHVLGRAGAHVGDPAGNGRRSPADGVGGEDRTDGGSSDIAPDRAGAALSSELQQLAPRARLAVLRTSEIARRFPRWESRS